VIASELADSEPVELISLIALTVKARVDPGAKLLNVVLNVFAAKD
jgi:hypothetical protein